MSNPFQIVPSDTFLNILNQNNYSVVDMDEDYRAEQDWMFENDCNVMEEQILQQEPLMPERSKALIGGELLQKYKKNKDDELLKKNKEVFQANQSKSIYLNKIQQLIDKPTMVGKPKQTRQKVIVDSDSSDGKNRLAKNRESARNSRKRKKVYIELLEIKVKELTEQLQQLEYVVQQNKIKHLQLENFIEDYHRSIAQLNDTTSIQLLHENFGATSQRRWMVCTELINLLIETTIPIEVKKLMESAKKGTDMFIQPLLQHNPCLNYRDYFKQGTIDLEIATKNFGLAYDKIREQVFALERFKQDIIQKLGAHSYIEYLNSQQL
ncbi:unnamed protein product (macronuclear) [Paramecium tetraurelia]|uniref:BZIP domain-containing protein n=1 Tax=Paramecium tetraurelia TaxID=5888 RepID=A0BFX0_PARTE|nr:uncharacterized protein GSPATT00028472001 [Paramecium tetraurelia]CAK57437.1 unnamed protein product [Paramecium tetraurelia]|eukprot:XP_001424835.1 hypothetical protein (macronuclear) [Paramecium tetraurelia strain d4-2]